MYHKTLTFLSSAILFLFMTSCSSVESYIEKGDYANAEKFCSEQKGEDQTKCTRTLADSYFYKQKDYNNAALSYKKLGDNAMYEKSIFENATGFVNKKDYDTAGQMFCSIKKYDWFRNVSDTENEGIIQLNEIDKKLVQYNKLQSEKSGKKFFQIYSEVDSLKKDFSLQVNRASTAGLNMAVLNDVNARMAYANKRLKELKAELDKLPKKDRKDGEKIQKDQNTIVVEITKICDKKLPKIKGIVETADGYIRQSIPDIEKK